MSSNQLSNIRILVVDDEKMIRRLITDVLSHLGFNSVTAAETGQKAKELVKKDFFDFIITDWRMHDLNGIDLIRYIRESNECLCARSPIIMLTGNTEIPYILEARDAGVTEYMIKPFSAQELVKRIRAIIENPRSFVEAPHFMGPSRRRRNRPPPDDVEKRIAHRA